jgi:hypothetical protein
MSTHLRSLAFGVALVALAPMASAHDEGGGGKGRALGNVKFPVSCNVEAQKRFNHAMALTHSFWYQAALVAFQDTLKADPYCAMAHWGTAVALRYNPFAPPPAENLPKGWTAVEQARGLVPKTQRERDYIDAIAAFYQDHDKVSHNERVAAHLKAMEKVATSYPQDTEAQLYYALALNVGASPLDKTYANQLKAASILEGIFEKQPKHPGVAHYLIHTYDYPPIANKGLDAARRYSKIAPDSPHALHMPSHIFTRLGLWTDSIQSNATSAKIAATSKEAADQLHAMDYLVYAYLQRGQDAAARKVLGEMKAVKIEPGRFAGVFAIAAAPARYAIERNDWASAAALEPVVSSLPFCDAISHFGRAIGAARSGKPEAAKPEIAKLVALREKLVAAKNSYWADQVQIQQVAAEAWVAHAEGRKAEALKQLETAAVAEDKTEKHAVTPGPLLPAREMVGDMLMLDGKPAEALAAYEATLAKEPNRLRTLVGAIKAARAAGDTAKAQRHAATLAQVAAPDAERAELKELRQLASR